MGTQFHIDKEYIFADSDAAGNFDTRNQHFWKSAGTPELALVNGITVEVCVLGWKMATTIKIGNFEEIANSGLCTLPNLSTLQNMQHIQIDPDNVAGPTPVKLLELTADRIVMRDVDGTTKFDSSQRMLRAIEFYSGTISLPAQSGFTGHLEEQVIDSSVNPNAQYAIGVFRVRNCSNAPYIGAEQGSWFMFGGSYVHECALGADPVNGYCLLHQNQARIISVFIDGTNLKLRAWTVTQEHAGSITIASVDLDYKIWTVTFD